ncbi:hypothetical protein BU16DRAFT_397904 [Lophium mytilinum]|uniref:histidine kinase n=1 Tax=Lophium mytilinum TaxID=390894 RepID=A0A6A6QUD1_9PEZI|nr:hypothetical protein BU16DRAFT_397904 [Lophium mytilinum]
MKEISQSSRQLSTTNDPPAGSPTNPSHPSPNRPLLFRWPRTTPPEITDPEDTASPNPRQPRPDDESGTESEVSDAAAEDSSQMESESGESDGGVTDKAPSPDEVELQRLRAAIAAKMLQKEQRARMSAANSRGGTPGQRTRVSPIREEPASSLSPTLEASFATPLATGLTSSSESTESAKTIRGSVPPTPGVQPLRTPSYPFPTVPGTPKPWNYAFHQPFTSLSPTVGASNAKDQSAPRERISPSASSTPLATADTFLPTGIYRAYSMEEDSRYPSPSLYDLALQLGSEPGLKAWWSTVISILREWYGVERATLAVPADASDIENVPWGQKTSFNQAGEVLKPSHSSTQDSKSSSDSYGSHTSASLEAVLKAPSALFLPTGRPKLETRHSFAGYERQRKEAPVEKATGPPTRPPGPIRTASLAPHTTPRGEHPLRQITPSPLDGSPFFQSPSSRDPSFSDPEFSNHGGDASTEPYAIVFPVLRALDHESDPLIDTAGINRVLERGKLVTLTRDYSVSTPNSRKNSTEDTEEHGSRTTPYPPISREFQKAALRGKPGHANNSENKLLPQYEEYEQFPSSPWAQSPAPSPAIQTDSSENPFFAAETNVDDDTFNPTETTQDYSRFSQVEAIGVDKASTVTHIPLIHPILSQTMQPLDPNTPSQTPTMSRRSTGSILQDPQPLRKAPIAILSILSSTVPYPQNLTNSLKLLGPHLATSFSNAWQYTTAHQQATGIRHRRYMSGHQVGFAPIHGPESLDDLMRFDLDDVAGSQAGSVTSPSDYSGRSRQSPGGSLGGTPGWDPSAAGFSSKHSVGGTPGHVTGSELVDSYFDSKKRAAYTTPAKTPGGQPPQEQILRKVSSAVDSRSTLKKATSNTPHDIGEDDIPTPRSDPKPKPRTISSDVQDQSTAQSQPLSPRRLRTLSFQPPNTADRKPHSLLHSYGADFSSSFQSLPSAAVPGIPQTPGPTYTPGHARGGSVSDTIDLPSMPPPSERLLRTIIDSLPVQIFTAQPSTGAMTWFNSKYMVYRGGDSQHALSDPYESIHPEEREAYIDHWNKSLRTGQQLQQKVRLLRFDGQYRWFYVRVAPLKDKKQQIVHWIGTNMDFHEQHLAEANSARQQETAASEAKYRALANSSPQIVFVVTNKRGITFCNSQWLSYSGQEEAQTLGIGFLEHVHPHDIVKCRLPVMNEDGSAPANVPVSVPIEHARGYSSSSDNSSETDNTVTSPGGHPATMEMPQAKLSKLASEGILKITKDADGRPSYSTEVRLRSKDGNYRWHLVRILLENSVSSEPRNEETWYGTCTDINDHKLLEQTLKETMDAKSRFLSNMSHEIRTPLNGITGMVNFLLDSPLSSEQMEHVNIIRNSTEGLRDLINDILDLSKVEAGMITLNVDWLHLPSLIEEVNDLTSALAIGKGLELNYLVEEEVPSMVKGDRFRIRQVLLNVIGNAIKFTEKGEVFVRCQLSADQPKNGDDHETVVQFEVIDTGSGFTKKEAEFLFKRFSQIDASSTRQHGGTGLGLAISMQLVELHGGKMKATSVPNEGSNFTFTINFGLPHGDDRPPTPIATPGTSMVATPARTPLPPSAAHTDTVARMQRFAAESPGHTGFTESPSLKSPAPSLPSSERSRDSPSLSSGSSDPSIYTGKTSLRSERSSVSSFMPDSAIKNSPIELALPDRSGSVGGHGDSEESIETNVSAETVRAKPINRSLSPLGSTLQPPMYSILVICPLKYSREATVKHVKRTLPKAVPHQVTSKASLEEARELIGGEDPVLFTHVILVLSLSSDVIAFMDLVFKPSFHSSTSMIIISDTMQKREIMKDAPQYDYEKLVRDRRLRFIYKPLKPSKFAVIFDPQKERDLSTDRNQDSAQQVAVTQKLVFEDLKNRLGNRGFRVLLVEDNYINQTVILKFLSKVSVTSETVVDGVQCTESVFSKPPGYYSIILCDLHMPNKDGYQACKEIRRWEHKMNYAHLPIIALSANVLGDVYSKCVEAGFNSYVTKPVEFKELSLVLTKFLDPKEKGKPHEFMVPKPHK